MNWDQVRGQWMEARNVVRVQWGRLTDDDLDVIGGRREHLVGILQKRYGQLRTEIERQVSEFEDRPSIMQSGERRGPRGVAPNSLQ
jgi:uncharacterized protein YjbJ (UPF0337 family)